LSFNSINPGKNQLLLTTTLMVVFSICSFLLIINYCCFGFYIHHSLPFLRQPPVRGLLVSNCSRGALAFTIVAAALQKYLLRVDYSVVKELWNKVFYNLLLFSMPLY